MGGVIEEGGRVHVLHASFHLYATTITCWCRLPSRPSQREQAASLCRLQLSEQDPQTAQVQQQRAVLFKGSVNAC